MTTPTIERQTFNVGVIKAPSDSDARAVEREAGTQNPDQNFYNIISAGDDDEREVVIGQNATYALDMTEDEAATLLAADHVRYVEPVSIDDPQYVGSPGAMNIPTAETWAWLRASSFPDWDGRDVLVAVLDQGTTQAVRDFMGFTLVERRIFGDTPPNGQELFSDATKSSGYAQHGCYVAPNCVPYGGRLLDYMVIASDLRSRDTYFAAAVRAACDAGCRIINYSFGSAPGGAVGSVYTDAAAYASNVGAQIFIAMGNDNTAGMGVPAVMSKTNGNVISVTNFDQNTDARWPGYAGSEATSGSNYDPAATMCCPGASVTSLNPDASVTLWNGTSAASPHGALCCARGCTRGAYTAAQVVAAMKATLRDTGQGAAQQGGGALDFTAMIANLTGSGATATGAGTSTPSVVGWYMYAGVYNTISFATASGTKVDDLRLFCIVAATDTPIYPPANWSLIRDQSFSTNNQRLRIYAKPYTADEPANSSFDCPNPAGPGYGWYAATLALTVRASAGIDISRIVAMCKFFPTATAGSLSTPSMPPRQTNDLAVDFYFHRDTTAANAGTLSLPAGDTQLGYVRTTGTNGFQALSSYRTLASGGRTAAATSTPDAADAGGGALVLIIPGTPTPVAYTSVVRRQLCLNPSLEVDTSAHSINFTRSGVSASTIYRSSGTVPVPTGLPGSFYGYVSLTAPNTGGSTSDCDINLPTFPVTAGLSYAISTFLNFSVAGSYVFYVRFEDGSGTKLSESDKTIVSIGTINTWNRVNRIMTAPTNAVLCRPQLWLYGVGDNTPRSFRWDGTLYEQSTTLRDYFDGSLSYPGTGWDGAAHVSTSTYRSENVGKQFAMAPVLAA